MFPSIPLYWNLLYVPYFTWEAFICITWNGIELKKNFYQKEIDKETFTNVIDDDITRMLGITKEFNEFNEALRLENVVFASLVEKLKHCSSQNFLFHAICYIFLYVPWRCKTDRNMLLRHTLLTNISTTRGNRWAEVIEKI